MPLGAAGSPLGKHHKAEKSLENILCGSWTKANKLNVVAGFAIYNNIYKGHQKKLTIKL